MTPIPIWTPCGRPPCWGSAVAVPPEVSVGSGGGGCSAAVEVVLAGALVVDVTGDVVVPVLDEDGVLLDDEEDDVERVVVVETVALDTLMRLSPTQNGPSISPPPQVCPSAQHMLPHWKSPTAQTRVQPAVSAPAEQQRKAPLSREHVSPAAPSSKWLVSAPVLGTRGWRFTYNTNQPVDMSSRCSRKRSRPIVDSKGVEKCGLPRQRARPRGTGMRLGLLSPLVHESPFLAYRRGCRRQPELMS
jgi:hypothetical protein